MLLLLFRSIFAGQRQLRLHIFADDSQCFLVAVARSAHDAGLHFLCFCRHAILPKNSGGNTHQMEDVAVLPQQRAERAGVLLPDGAKPAQPVGNIVGQPCAAECAVGLQTPHRQLPHIHLNVLEGEQQIVESIVLKNLDRLKAAAILQDAVLRQQVIDAIQLGNLLLASILEMQQTTELLCTKVLMERIMYLTKQHLGLESSVI